MPDLGVLGTPRLVVSDLDGTLLRSDGTVAPRTVAAVAALQAAGVGWVIATARPPRWMHDLTDVVGRGGVAICSNGAFVYDVVQSTILAERTISDAVVRDLVVDLRASVPDIAFAFERDDGFAREHAFVDEYREGTGRRGADALDLLDRPVGKLLARSASLDPADFFGLVTEVVADRAVFAFSGFTGLAEISARGVTKAAVLSDWCAERGVSAQEVWAFGDMPNDLDMLAWAGESFAVANGHHDVLRVADHVIAGNDDDGVAQLLETVVGRLTPSSG